MSLGLGERCKNALLLRQFMAEFAGTTVLLLIGDGSVAQSVLSDQAAGAMLSINIAWGLAVTFGIMVSANVSGAHLNPAISLTQCLLGGISVAQMFVFMCAQYIGAFTGAALVYSIYYQALNNFDGGVRCIDGVNGTAGIFATYPQQFLNAGGGFVDQVVGTALLSALVLAVTDKRNVNIPAYLHPAYIGSIVLAIGLALGFNCGYAINPARDLGPRVFTAIAGWGSGVFSYNNWSWFWVPVVGPYLGGVLGALVYKVLVGWHWPVQNSVESIHEHQMDSIVKL